jgi:5-methylcytosine-specific restriction endonuclease McrA
MVRPCLGYPGYRCPRLIQGASRCGDCQRAKYQVRNRQRDPWIRAFYGSSAWKALRIAVVEVADRCAWCDRPKSEVRLSAGHVVSIAKDRSLALSPENVRASCASCQERVKYEPDPRKWRGVRR